MVMSHFIGNKRLTKSSKSYLIWFEVNGGYNFVERITYYENESGELSVYAQYQNTWWKLRKMQRQNGKIVLVGTDTKIPVTRHY